jgi:fluoride exporter
MGGGARPNRREADGSYRKVGAICSSGVRHVNAIYLVIGGSVGTLARYYAGIWITNAFGARTLSTFVVNIVGSFVIGVFLALGQERDPWSNALVLLVAVGFLGGFTTFSTFAWQTLQLAESGEQAQAMLNVAGSVVIGMLAVWSGATIARALA